MNKPLKTYFSQIRRLKNHFDEIQAIKGDNFNIFNALAQTISFYRVNVFRKIGADPAAQVDRFTHIDNFVVFIFMQIDTRRGGEVF